MTDDIQKKRIDAHAVAMSRLFDEFMNMLRVAWTDYGISQMDIMAMIYDRSEYAKTMPKDEFMQLMGGAGVMPTRMGKALDELLATAPKLNPGDAPAMEFGLMIRFFSAPLFGIVSRAPSGLVKLMQPDPQRKDQMVEIFVEEDDIVSIVHTRKVVKQGSSIILGG